MRIKLIVAVLTVGALMGACKGGIPVECRTKADDDRFSDAGTAFTVQCPAGCTSGSVWGSDTYTTESAICVSPVHAGVITAADGGAVEVQLGGELPSYTGSERNGVSTSDWATSWDSYTVH